MANACILVKWCDITVLGERRWTNDHLHWEQKKILKTRKKKKKLTSSFYIYTYTHTYIYMHMRKSELAYKILWVMGSHLWWFFLSFVLIEEFKNIYRLVWMRSTKNSVCFFFFLFFLCIIDQKKKCWGVCC